MDALTCDPLNPCPPVGAMFAAFGLHATLPLSHGASGCCRFQRMEISKHFQRTVHVPSTMLRDDAAVFGGAPNVAEAIGNVFTLYDPQVVLLHSTCMSETIGDDLRGMIEELEIPAGKRVVWTSTPGYAGSHLLGYSSAVCWMLEQLGGSWPTSDADATKPDSGRLLLIPGWVNPCDVEVLCAYAEAFFQTVTVLPDVRDVMDAKPSDNPRTYCHGGTTLSELDAVGESASCVAVGREAASEPAQTFARLSAGRPAACLALPIGISATDTYVGQLAAYSGGAVPAWIRKARTRAVECLVKTADSVFGRKVAVVCDADTAVGMASFLVDVGLEPACIAVGSCRPDFIETLHEQVKLPAGCEILAQTDRLHVEDWLVQNPVDAIMGDTRNKRMAARLGVPLVRVGFPVVDRPLHYTVPLVGYDAATDLLRRVAGALAQKDEQGLLPEELSVSRYF